MIRLILLFLAFSVSADEVDRDIQRYEERARYQELRADIQRRDSWRDVREDSRELRRKLERSNPCYSWQSRCE